MSSELIGRSEELLRLYSALDDVERGESSLVLISGEAGAGKTRLAMELEGAARGRGAAVRWGRCWEEAGPPVFWPWRQALGEENPDEIPWSTGDAFAVVSPLIQILQRDAAPVVLILDDVHAADEPSMRLLRAVAEQIRGRSVLVCATYRPERLRPGRLITRTVLRLQRDAVHIDLRPLDSEGTAALFEQSTGYSLPAATLKAAQRASGGNPFFIKEIADLVARRMTIQRPDMSSGFIVPGTARELIDQQLNDLTAGARSTLRVAAVLGYEFDRAVLDQVLRDPEAGVGHLDEAVERRVVEVRSSLGRYAFKHALVRDVLYQELPTAERSRVHLAAARSVQAMHGSESDRYIGQVADHLFKAGPGEHLKEGLSASRRAAEIALGSDDHEAARRHLHRASRIAELTNADAATRDEVAAALARLDGTVTGALSAATSEPNRFVREGEYWSVTFGGNTARLKDSKGLRYLETLLRAPGREFLALDLVAASGRELRGPSIAIEGTATAGTVEPDLLDDTARRAYRARLVDLREELEEADAFHDTGRTERARAEIAALERELAAAFGLGGRSRKASSDIDRARMSVTRALRTAIERVAEPNPGLARHLDATIKTGTYVSYTPDPRVPPDWQF